MVNEPCIVKVCVPVCKKQRLERVTPKWMNRKNSEDFEYKEKGSMEKIQDAKEYG